MEASDATWKLWGNEVTLMRLRISPLGATDLSARVVSADAWDGYPTERKELMTFLSEKGISNVVVLSGDIHASFAGLVRPDFDVTTAPPVACELVASGISSNSLFSFFEAATKGGDPTLRGLITVDAATNGNGGAKFTENFNLLLLAGINSAGTFAGAIAAGALVGDALGAALAVATPATNPNPHLKYVDSNAQGYGYVQVTAAQVAATIVTINRPISTPSDAGPGVKRTVSFTIPKDHLGEMTGPTFTGTAPFPVV
jgi:alkaline phosphatase D